MRSLATDVLVIGTGGAGLVAAITSREQGAEVLAVAKGPIGGANCTVVSHAGFRGSVTGFTKEEHFRVTMQAGTGLNEPGLVRILTEEADKVLTLRRMGVPIQERSRGYFCHGQPGAEGGAIIKPLVNYAQKIGVQLLPHVLIWELLMEEGVVVGAWGLDYGGGEYVQINARVVILASGGAGAVYSRTDNPLRTTGDGYALAYRAGLGLADMEFVQFFPLSNADPTLPKRPISAMAADVGRILNRNGEDVVKKHGITVHPIAIQARDLLSRAICLEVAEGRGISEAIVLDLTKSGTEDWQRGDELFGEKSAENLRKFLDRHFNIMEKPLLVLPTCHFLMGGIPIDGEGRTGMDGLIAVGEVTAGVHGANRLGGNALTETVVFGERGGLEAAEMAKTKRGPQATLPETHIRAKINALPLALAGYGADNKPLAEVRNRLRELMWDKVGVLRNESGLSEGLAEILYLGSGCRWNFDAKSVNQVVEAMELRNLVLVAESITRAARERQESRGSHYREDYPNKNEAVWGLHVVVKHGRDGMEIKHVPVGELSGIREVAGVATQAPI